MCPAMCLQCVVYRRSIYAVCNFQRLAKQRMMRWIDMADKLHDVTAIPGNLKEWVAGMQDPLSKHL